MTKPKDVDLDSDDVTVVVEQKSAEQKSPEQEALELEKLKIVLEREAVALSRERYEREIIRLQYFDDRLGSESFDLFNGRIYLNDMVDDDSINKLRRQIHIFLSDFEADELTVEINSPGGYVTDGFALYGLLREVSKGGLEIHTVVSGMAASMAGVIAQAGDKRFIREGSVIMVHEPSGGGWGSKSEMGDAHERLEAINQQMIDIYAKKTKMTKAQLKKKFERKDWWLTDKEALELGFVDKIL